jgi:ribonuclease R
LDKNKLPCLYRVHEGPKNEKLEKLRAFLKELSIPFMVHSDPKPQDYQTVLGSIKDRPDFELIQTVMLRSMNQAVYSPENKGHFGLAYTAYAHFTSPIRRYPDLLVHRAIRYFVRSGKDSPNTKCFHDAPPIPQEKILPYTDAAMVELGEQCSMTERRADEATWDVIGWLKCEYMSDKIGDVFKGIISGVTNFGLFVELKDIYVEGLIHVSSLTSDYYHFDEVRHRLVGERSGLMFGLGEEVTVSVGKVNLDDRKIDFDLLAGGKRVRWSKEDGAKPPSKGKKDSKSKARGTAGSESAKSAAKKPKGGSARHKVAKAAAKKSRSGSKPKLSAASKGAAAKSTGPKKGKKKKR